GFITEAGQHGRSGGTGAEVLAHGAYALRKPRRIEKKSPVERIHQLAYLLGRNDLTEAAAERVLQIDGRVGAVEHAHQERPPHTEYDRLRREARRTPQTDQSLARLLNRKCLDRPVVRYVPCQSAA